MVRQRGCKYLIAYKGLDDDFDTDNGFPTRAVCYRLRQPGSGYPAGITVLNRIMMPMEAR